MSRRATLSLAALLAATVITGSVAIVGIAHHAPATPVPGTPIVRSAPTAPQTPPVAAGDHGTQEVD